MEKHLTVCAKRPKTSIPNGAKTIADSEFSVDRISMMEENLVFLRKSLNEEIQMRHDMIEELGGLKRRNQVWKFEKENRSFVYT